MSADLLVQQLAELGMVTIPIYFSYFFLFIMPAPGQNGLLRHYFFLSVCLSFVRPSVRLSVRSVCCKTYEHETLRRNKPISVQIGRSGVYGTRI